MSAAGKSPAVTCLVISLPLHIHLPQPRRSPPCIPEASLARGATNHSTFTSCSEIHKLWLI
ncbi:unnamed protein product [Gulo gulo]|uniref:Uncharacterized protein n=1 Tax=Gulo gulo TaxID=48420 RepID=A0A9X9LUA5_GULGU|nr:unnamed protein product [Gulo gulo]